MKLPHRTKGPGKVHQVPPLRWVITAHAQLYLEKKKPFHNRRCWDSECSCSGSLARRWQKWPFPYRAVWILSYCRGRCSFRPKSFPTPFIQHWRARLSSSRAGLYVSWSEHECVLFGAEPTLPLFQQAHRCQASLKAGCVWGHLHALGQPWVWEMHMIYCSQPNGVLKLLCWEVFKDRPIPPWLGAKLFQQRQTSSFLFLENKF